jgi:hypothetical protein
LKAIVQTNLPLKDNGIKPPNKAPEEGDKMQIDQPVEDGHDPEEHDDLQDAEDVKKGPKRPLSPYIFFSQEVSCLFSIN